MMPSNLSSLSFTRIAMLAAVVPSLFHRALAGVGDPSTMTLTGAARVTLSPDPTSSQSYYISDEAKPCNEANSTNATEGVSDAPHHYHVHTIDVAEEEEDDDSFQASESPLPSMAPSALRGKQNSAAKEAAADTKDLRERGTFAMEQGMHHLKHLKQLVHLLDGNMGSSQSNYKEGAQEDTMTTKWRHIHAHAVDSLKEAFDLFLQVKEAATLASEGLAAQERLRQVREHLVELQSNALAPPAAIGTSQRPARALRSRAIKM